MAQRTDTQLRALTDLYIFQNTSRLVTADNVNNLIQDFIDSKANLDSEYLGLKEFSININYAVGTCVVYNGDVYQCTTAHSSGAWNPANFTQITQSIENIEDTIAAFIQNGTGITWTYNDIANTLTGNVSLSPFSTTDLAEGTNLYFTESRVRATPLTGYSVGANSVILSTDTILQAFGKVQGQINAITPVNLANSNLIQTVTTHRTYTLGAATANDSLSFIYGTTNALAFKGSGVMTMLTNTYAPGYDLSVGDATNRKKIIYYVADTDGIVWHDGTNARAKMSVLAGASDPLWEWYDSDAALRFDYTYQGNMNLYANAGGGKGTFTVKGSGAATSFLLENGPTDAMVMTLYEAGVTRGKFDGRTNNPSYWLGDFGIGVSPLHRFHVKGSTSDNSANALYVCDSSDVGILKAINDGYFVQRLRSSVITDAYLFNNSVSLYTNGTHLLARYKNNTGTASDLVVGAGDALTTNPLSQFASTTSAQLAGVISDETGSGPLVFSVSPTLTGDVVLNSNLTLTPVVNNSLSGANQRIPSHTVANMIFTNAGLTSIGSANNGGVGAGHTLTITNSTGASITIVNNYGGAAAGETILTGLGADIILPNNCTIWLQYSTTASLWSCVNGGMIPVAGITPSTSTAIGVGSIELGHASDTTLARVSAGVVSIEGVNIVTVSASQTLTNKTLTTPAIASIKGTITTDTDGATITFDKNVSDFHNVVMAGNRTLALSNMAAGDRIVLRLVQDATGSRIPTWFTTIKWAGGVAPTLTTTANKADVFSFLCTSVGNYDGFVIGQNI